MKLILELNIFNFFGWILAALIEEEFIKLPDSLNGFDCNIFTIAHSFTVHSKISCADKCSAKRDKCFSFTYKPDPKVCRLHTNVITDTSKCVISHSVVNFMRKVDGTLWPVGSYGLMRSSVGCPGNLDLWTEGYLLQDTEGENFLSAISNAVHVYGLFRSSDVTTGFCMKDILSDTRFHDRPSWPMGSYCILKYGDCPSGLTPGYITWDDEDLTNINMANGSLPDGTYNSDITTVFYCCRNDSLASRPIVLPTASPFILLRKGLTCQTVQGMNVVEEWISWETEGTDNDDKFGGNHPDLFREIIDVGIKLFFCYYS